MKKTKYVIGIDPDCDKSGVAVFVDGEMSHITNMDLLRYTEYCITFRDRNDVTFVIEDGNMISGLYHRNTNRNKAVQHKISERVGANKQRATDLIAIAEHYGIKVVRQKPRVGNWAKKKPMFEKWTGWKGKSNPETRSAAFFGYMYSNS